MLADVSTAKGDLDKNDQHKDVNNSTEAVKNGKPLEKTKSKQMESQKTKPMQKPQRSLLRHREINRKGIWQNYRKDNQEIYREENRGYN